ncbi:MAG TPA: TRAP transporter large permease subunit [Candidatus Pseudogracilibacillus intestinigallinarum]|uniref:TRAP transporter large permease subunit n=1 Tax=Candidatus Pseudogracilibacillus intestinigallinarum TaxID=2838742 RepID=A0A9D1PLD9_9BACI|nr:TRAP transporter large permease subunit [Candidatus Pseudogracilibacillus intestinigallinarum]
MSAVVITVLMFIVLFVFLFLGLPVALGLGGTAVVFAMIFEPRVLMSAPSQFFSTPWQHIIVTVPLFIFMGNIIRFSGIAEKAYDAAYKIIGQFPGGLAAGTVQVCMIFAAITGITPPATITMGQIAYPSMIKYNYSKKIAIGSIAAGGALGALIPPSIPFIFYGVLANESIGALFLGGVIPGIMLAIMYSIYIIVRCTIQPQMGPATPKDERFSLSEKLLSVFSIWPFIILIVLVLGVIWTGVATPSEAAAIGAAGALLINAVYGKLTWKLIKDSLIFTVNLTGMGLWILIGANFFVNVFSAVGGQGVITNIVLSMPGGDMGILLSMMFIVLILGMVMDDWAIIMMTTPLFIPILNQVGIDTLWYGILLVVNIQIAYLTPPFGFVLFWIKSILPKNVHMGTVYKAVLPFIAIQLIALTILIVFPEVALWLPNKLLK